MNYLAINHQNKGQALVTLLIFMIIAVTVTGAAIVVIFVNSLSTGKFQQSDLAYYTAESGQENAIIQLLRDENYSGETMTIGGNTAIISIVGENPKQITVEGYAGNFKRIIQAQVQLDNHILNITSWKEID